MTTALFSSAYLPPVQYFAHLLAADRAVIEQHDHYMKQTYRNRCTIAAPDGPLALTVPIIKPDSPKCPMRDIRISDHGNWRHLHWNALNSSYNHTPFFEYYKDDFRPFYEEKRYEFLMDYNEALVRLLCELTDIDLTNKLSRTESYCQSSPDMLDYRETIHPKRDTLTADPAFVAHPYYQAFADKLGFLPNLSMVDLLFNMGPESLLVLRQCHAALPR